MSEESQSSLLWLTSYMHYMNNQIQARDWITNQRLQSEYRSSFSWFVWNAHWRLWSKKEQNEEINLIQRACQLWQQEKKQICFYPYIVLQSHFSSRLCNGIKSDISVDRKQKIVRLLGEKQIKDRNLVAVNLLIWEEHYVDLKKDLQLKSKTFGDRRLLKRGGNAGNSSGVKFKEKRP